MANFEFVPGLGFVQVVSDKEIAGMKIPDFSYPKGLKYGDACSDLGNLLGLKYPDLGEDCQLDLFKLEFYYRFTAVTLRATGNDLEDFLNDVYTIVEGFAEEVVLVDGPGAAEYAKTFLELHPRGSQAYGAMVNDLLGIIDTLWF